MAPRNVKPYVKRNKNDTAASCFVQMPIVSLHFVKPVDAL